MRRSGPLSVDVVGGPNWAAFVAILSQGGYVSYRGVGLTLGEPQKGGGRRLGVVRAEIVSEWQSQNLTEARAMAELEHGKAVTEELVAESADVRDLVRDHGVQYELIEDYGTGSLLIAREKGGNLEWSYIEAHAVRLPQPIIDHCLSHSAEQEQAEIDREWWKNITRRDGQ